MKAVYWRVIPLVVFALLAVFFWRGLSLDPKHLPSARQNEPLPSFEVPILGSRTGNFTPAAMHGEVALLNVWASWCEACTEEQVFLLQLEREGVAIYGLNYKDNPDDAKHWLSEWGNPYKMTGSDIRGQVAIDLGVYGAPETFLLDKDGVIRYRHAGIMTAEVWQNEFKPRMAELEKAG